MSGTRNNRNRIELIALMGQRVNEITGDQREDATAWVTVVPDGHVKSSTGDFVMDATAAQNVIANFERKGNDVPVDYEHQTLQGAHTSPTGQAPAAGWITKLKYAAGEGLKGLVEWVWRTADLKTSTVPKQELQALRETTVTLEADTLLEKYSMQGKLTEAMYQDQKQRLLANIDEFDQRKQEFLSLMEAVPEIIPQGQLINPAKDSAPPGRDTLIHTAAREFECEPDLHKFTNQGAYVNLKLHEQGLALLTTDERGRFA